MKYRLVRPGETVQQDDQILCDDCINWRPATPIFVGMKYLKGFLPVRREIVENDD